MIVTRLYGGLGNQMFQYAAARRLSLRLGCELVIDISEFQYDSTYRYYLDYFRVAAQLATADDMWEIRRSREKRPVQKLLINLQGCFKQKRDLAYYAEPHFHFAESVLQLPDNVCMDGYWQSEKYFSDVADAIRAEYTIQNPMPEKSQQILTQIHAVDSVSLHVRRGDYVSNPAAYKVHGVCSVEYYKSCISYINQTLDTPHFFLFSDDPIWVKENLLVQDRMTIVEGNSAIEDMRLMSRCKHNIIANSSFSWWGAWLNTNPDKMVLAPRRWFQDATINTSDLYPSGWIAL